jgi:beta-N-acetylhexosaminidase
MVDVAGTALTPGEREMLCHPLVGGVILFTRNYVDTEQLTMLTAQIHALREPRLLVAVDHEGGRVQRFRGGFTSLPAAGSFGALYDTDPQRARRLAESCGWVMAAELRAVGVDFSFAPVLDLHRGVSSVIGDRAYHHKPEVVTELAQAVMRGMQHAGMAATGKHFPGHGAVCEDSHVALPVDSRSYDEIESEDLVPFRRLIKSGLAAIMPAHVIYDQVDAQPAGFSAFWIRDVLRKRLGFQGVVFSDDLHMAAAAVAGGYVERARAALTAGCDMVLVCNDPAGAAEVLSGLGDYDDPVSHMRLARMHGRRETALTVLHRDRVWQQAVAALKPLDDSPWLELDV